MPRRLVVPILMLAWAVWPAAVAHAARDRDHDGLPDRWERRYDLSTARPSARVDRDHDGLSNRREFKLRTNPRKRDTDHDGLRDGAEVKRYRTNPRRRDTDHDGLGDRAEIKRYHTNPRKRDTDHDGLSDGAEVKRWHTNPRKRDSDGDGIPDGAEVAAGTATPSTPSTAGPAPSPPAGGFPSPATTGVPAGWVPAQTLTSDLDVTTPGAVIQDVLLQNADIVVDAPNVTIRRVRLQGGSITNFTGSPCQPGMVIEDSTIEPAPGQQFSSNTEGVIEVGGYTARRVKIWRRSEGFRSGADCGPVRIENSFASIATPDGTCSHADGIQGAGAPWTTMINSTIDFREVSCGTAPFFFPQGQGNDGVTIDRLLVMGGGYPFRLGAPGTVTGLKIVDKSWAYGPIAVNCAMLSSWNASIVTITSDYQIARTVRSQPCSTDSS
jgi:thrombospondin type 3 repeat protein